MHTASETSFPELGRQTLFIFFRMRKLVRWCLDQRKSIHRREMS